MQTNTYPLLPAQAAKAIELGFDHRCKMNTFKDCGKKYGSSYCNIVIRELSRSKKGMEFINTGKLRIIP